MARRNRRLTWRMALLILTLLVGTGGIIMRLVQVQIIDHDYYAAQADEEHLHRTVVRAPRGAILDRNGFPLATTVTAFDVYIDPRSWGDDDVALRGAAALGPPPNKQPPGLITPPRAPGPGDHPAPKTGGG